jgi:hypothetical protein
VWYKQAFTNTVMNFSIVHKNGTYRYHLQNDPVTCSLSAKELFGVTNVKKSLRSDCKDAVSLHLPAVTLLLG